MIKKKCYDRKEIDSNFANNATNQIIKINHAIFRVLSGFAEDAYQCKDSYALGNGLLQLLIALDHYSTCLERLIRRTSIIASLRKIYSQPKKKMIIKSHRF